MSPPASAEVPAVEVTGVHKAFGTTEVLHGVDLVVPGAGVTAILGPSGCGKTTLLRLVAGFDTPDAGVIRVAGREVAGARVVPPQRRGVGYVPQEGALFPHLTAAGNITFGLSARRRRARDRVAELLELVGLPMATADRYPHQLSGGQQQRVALARALAPSPALVLLDEPFASLDAGLREETRRATGAALTAAGAAAVLVTHDQDEALSFATHVAVMREGRIVQSADPRRLYAAPADVGVARFVGAAVVLTGVLHAGTASCALGTLPVSSASDSGFGSDSGSDSGSESDSGFDSGSGSGDGPVQLLVRPEQVLVHTSAVPGSVRARVLDVAYYGHDGTAQLRLADDVRVTARTQGGRLPAPGTDVHLTVDGPVLAYPQQPPVP